MYMFLYVLYNIDAVYCQPHEQSGGEIGCVCTDLLESVASDKRDIW